VSESRRKSDGFPPIAGSVKKRMARPVCKGDFEVF